MGSYLSELLTILDDIVVENFRDVKTHGFVFYVRKGRYFLELINDVIVRVVQGGIFTHMQKRNSINHKCSHSHLRLHEHYLSGNDSSMQVIVTPLASYFTSPCKLLLCLIKMVAK